MILLTDEEMLDIGCDFQKDILETGEIGKLSDAIAKAQLKKVVDELKEGSYPRLEGGLRDGHFVMCIQDNKWQALLEEVGEKVIDRGSFAKYVE